MTDIDIRFIAVQASYIDRFDVELRDLNWRYLSVGVTQRSGGDVVQPLRFNGDGGNPGGLPGAAAEPGFVGGTGDWAENCGALEEQ